MGQILTLMVFGDAITVNNDDDIEDGEMNGALISGPPGPETCDPEVSCGRSASTAGGAPHGTDSSADAAGQRVGEHSRRGSSALDTWKCAVHRHRTGLRGEVRRPDATGSGDDEDHLLSAADEWDPGGRSTEPRAVHDDDDERRMLLDIMSVADRAARLDALRRYLAAAAYDRDRPVDAEIAAAPAGKRRSATP